jgi:photosystem II stability/assembly factor-like uncharacterized protein
MDISKSLAFILFNFSILCTLNAQWYIQNNGTNIGIIRDSQFLDENTGWLSVNGSKIYKTNNGGDDWICIDTLNYFIDAIHFIDSINGWGTGFDKIFHTQDGGHSWDIQLNLNTIWGQDFRDVFFIDENHGWVVGYDTVFYTINGGLIWQPVHVDLWLIWSVYFVNQDTGFIAGQQSFDGRIMGTTDGGLTWTNKISNIECEFKDITFIDETRGWIIGYQTLNYGQSMLAQTFDGGESWNVSQITGAYGHQSISFTDSLNGWCTGDNGSIWHTDDGGITWNSQITPTTNFLFTINFVNQYTGWATGLYGTILKTDNGGIVGIDPIISAIEDNEIVIFPNPTRDQLFLQTDIPNNFYELYNISGQKQWQGYLKSNNAIDISNLKNGVYLLKIHNNKEIQIKRIIKN